MSGNYKILNITKAVHKTFFRNILTNTIQPVVSHNCHHEAEVSFEAKVGHCQNRLFSLSSALHIPDPQHVTGDTIRTNFASVETSIRYLQSKAFKETYGDDVVWKNYKRNHKGQIPPKKTRKMCIRSGNVVTSNACPVCRDEYLVIDYRNVELLKHFISPITGEIYSYSITGVCQKEHENIIVELMKAKDYGYLVFDQPFRYYDYSEYYS